MVIFVTLTATLSICCRQGYKIQDMKNLGRLFLAALVLSAVLSACKSHEACPAYTSVDVENVDSNS